MILPMSEVRVLLDNVRSTYNVGAIFRTADAVGVSHIYLAGTTPAPIDRFGREQASIAKTALGAEKSVAHTVVGTSETVATAEIIKTIKDLRNKGFEIVAVEQSTESISLFEYQPSEKVLYILGAEVEGVQPDVLQVVDKIIEIPMLGIKESLNVSVTAGVVLLQRPF